MKKDEKEIQELVDGFIHEAMIFGRRMDLQIEIVQIFGLQKKGGNAVLLQFRKPQALAEKSKKESKVKRGRK